MGQLSRKLRKWRAPTRDEGLTYWCQACDMLHGIRIKGPNSWGWNEDVERPVFTPSVLTTWTDHSTTPPTESVCHTFVGCNGAQPGQVIFLSDCTHGMAGTVQPFPDLPDWMQEKP